MPLFGHIADRDYPESGPHKLREVCLAVPASDLRRLARFFTEQADKIESGAWNAADGMHYHLRDWEGIDDSQWWDVIISHPG